MKGNGWNGTLALLWTGQFLVTAGLTVFVPLLPLYMEELGAVDRAANLSWSGLALAAPAIPLVLAAPLWGRMGDTWGRKWMVVRALFGISASVILMGCATTPLEFLACRLLQGAFGGVDDAAAAFAGTHFPKEKLGGALGALQTATAAGALVGPLCGGFLSRLVGFPPLVISIGILIGLCGAAMAFLLRESAGKDARKRPADGEPLSRFVPAALAFLGNRRVLGFLLAGFCVQVGAYGLMNVFVAHIRDLSPGGDAAYGWVGFLQSATWAMTLAGASWWGRRNDQVAAERNFLLAAGGCTLAVALQALPTQVGWLLPLRMLQGFCHSALGQTVYLMASREASRAGQGFRIGLSNSFLTSGQVAGAVLGSVLGGVLPARAMFPALAGLFLVGGMLAWSGAGARKSMETGRSRTW